MDDERDLYVTWTRKRWRQSAQILVREPLILLVIPAKAGIQFDFSR